MPPPLLAPGSAQPRELLYRDIHAHDLLPAIAKARHRDGELILLTSDLKQLDLTVNLVASLAKLNLHHYLVLGDGAEVAAHAAKRGALAVAYSSLLDRYTTPLRANTSVALPCACQHRGRPCATPEQLESAGCVASAAAFYAVTAVRRLWLVRHHSAARLLGLRYRVLLLDSDSLVLADPYPALRSHLAAYAAIGLHDQSAGPAINVNGGTWYLRGAPGGPVHEAWKSIATRALRVLDAYPRTRLWMAPPNARPLRPSSTPANQLLFDQHVLNLVLVSAAAGRELWPCAACDAASDEIVQQQLASHQPRLGAWLPPDAPPPAALCCLRAEQQIVQAFVQAKGDQKAMTKATTWVAECCNATPPAFLRGAAVAAVAPRKNKWCDLGFGWPKCGLRPPPNDAPPPTRFGATALYGAHYGHRWLALRHASRSTPAAGAPLEERIAKAPAWLFSAESDVTPRGRGKRTEATLWGDAPPRAAVLHFVCSSWPGSDGRRQAMSLWGHWHAADVEAELGEAYASASAERRAAYVAFDRVLPARTPAELQPYLRLLMMVGRLTRRTPVLPLLPCERSEWGSAEEMERVVDERTSPQEWPIRRPDRGKAQWLRPCGWRLAHLHGRALPKALCVQRMPEGCFRTFATPTEVGRGMERAVGLGGGGGNHSFAVRVGPASDPRFGPAGSARALQGLVPRPSTTIEEDESTKAIVEAARAARRSVKAGGKARRTLFVDVADGWVEQSRLLHREGFVGALEKAVSLEAVRDTMAALSKWPSSRGEWRTCASNALVVNKCMAVC